MKFIWAEIDLLHLLSDHLAACGIFVAAKPTGHVRSFRSRGLGNEVHDLFRNPLTARQWTEDEYRHLLLACDFVFSRMISSESRFSILEIHARN